MQVFAPLTFARGVEFPGQKPGGTGGGAFGTLFRGTGGGTFDVLIGGFGRCAFDDGLADVLGSAPDAPDEQRDWFGCFGASFIGTP